MGRSKEVLLSVGLCDVDRIAGGGGDGDCIYKIV